MTKRALFAAPTTWPVSQDEVAEHLRLLSDYEAGYVEGLIEAATVYVEDATWRKLCTQTWDLYANAFADPIRLPYPPVASITSITYADTRGVSQTLASTVYELGEENGIGIVRLKYGQTWPATRAHEDDVKIRYVCGYGSASSVPQAIKHAIKLLCGVFHEGRESPTMPAAVEALLSPYRVDACR